MEEVAGEEEEEVVEDEEEEEVEGSTAYANVHTFACQLNIDMIYS